jgi:predicted dehydrogenase
MSATRPLRVAVIGAGFGTRLVIPGLRAVGSEVAALVGQSAARAAEAAKLLGIPHSYPAAQLDEALALPGLDLAFVASPPVAHCEQTVRALERGLHVVCEKPTAMNAREAMLMLETAKRAGRLALIDHELRFSPVRRRFRDLVREGFLGRVLHADLTIQGEFRLDPTRPWTWWSDAAQGGGFLGALGSHAIDAVRFTLGEVEAAWGRLRTLVRERPDPAGGGARPVTADDYALFWLEMEADFTVACSLSAVARAPRDEWRFAAHGRAGSLLLDQGERLWGRREGESEFRDLTPPAGEAPAELAATGLRDTPWNRAFLRFAAALRDTLRSGRTSLPDAASFEDGLRVQQIMDAIRESSTTGRRVECRATALTAGGA